MTDFPLYHYLVQQVDFERILTREEKSALARNIPQLDDDGRRKVVAIIIYFQRQHNLPCLEPKPITVIHLSQFPDSLLQTLQTFVKKHLQLMEEERRRNLLASE